MLNAKKCWPAEEKGRWYNDLQNAEIRTFPPKILYKTTRQWLGFEALRRRRRKRLPACPPARSSAFRFPWSLGLVTGNRTIFFPPTATEQVWYRTYLVTGRCSLARDPSDLYPDGVGNRTRLVTGRCRSPRTDIRMVLVTGRSSLLSRCLSRCLSRSLARSPRVCTFHCFLREWLLWCFSVLGKKKSSVVLSTVALCLVVFFFDIQVCYCVFTSSLRILLLV